MPTANITIEVDDAAARAFAETSAARRQEMQFLLSFGSQELIAAPGKTIQTITDEIGRLAY